MTQEEAEAVLAENARLLADVRVLREAAGGRVALGGLRQEEAEALLAKNARLLAEVRVLREATGGRVAVGGLRQEEAEALVAENARLRAEVGVLQEEVARLRQQLQAALERIKALEEGKSDPPSFVMPYRPTACEREGPR